MTFPPKCNLPFPPRVIDMVAAWCDYDFACDVTLRDVELYRRMVLDITGYGKDGEPGEYGLYLPDH